MDAQTVIWNALRGALVTRALVWMEQVQRLNPNHPDTTR